MKGDLHDERRSLRSGLAPWSCRSIHNEGFSLRSGSHLLASARTGLEGGGYLRFVLSGMVGPVSFSVPDFSVLRFSVKVECPLSPLLRPYVFNQLIGPVPNGMRLSHSDSHKSFYRKYL